MRSTLPFVRVLAAGVVFVGCGGGTPAPAEATKASDPPKAAAQTTTAKPAETAAPAEAPAEPVATSLPTECAKTADPKVCAPPVSFAKRLCAGFHPDVALSMFGKGTPWTRMYLRGNVKAWNASGGAASNEDELKFDEEVLVLVFRGAETGGMQVSGASGSYDVLRWDGSCATLVPEEVTSKPPPKAKHAKIPWKNLDTKIKDALLADQGIAKVDADRKKECKGATMGEVSAKCVKADDKLSAMIVDYVRKGGSVPPPEKLP
jgi:hypothetical protein